MAAGLIAARRDAGGEGGTRRRLSQRWDIAPAKRASGGNGLWHCSARGQERWSPTSFGEKSEQWQRALALLGEMLEARLEPEAIIHSAAISAGERGEKWQQAVSLFS
ncbi:unnamed protein product [Prorocentrum cordatum]|uniref:Uncharacterized protein n=1 Tax=Prorocentrum cordatum TaxID=2364126 RepID=A0ABN9XX38_9DINO|nr:unnamed protein product [Polarella glacialis]